MDSPGHKLSRNTNKRKSALKRRQKQSTLYSKPLTEIGENPSKHSPAGKPVSEWSLARRLIDGPDSPDVAPEEVPAARTPPLGSFPELLARTADAGFDARSAIRASVPIPVLVGRTHANKVTASRALRSGRWLRRALRASRFLPCREALSDIRWRSTDSASAAGPRTTAVLRGRLYSGLGFCVVFSSVFFGRSSDVFALSPVGVAVSGFCSPWP